MAIVRIGTSFWLLAGIGESHLDLVDPIRVEEGVEIAVAETFVDDVAQPVVLQAHHEASELIVRPSRR